MDNEETVMLVKEKEEQKSSAIVKNPSIDNLVDLRRTYYRGDETADNRRDLLCLCCGRVYRPDTKDPGNALVCLSCIAESEGR